MLSNRGRGTSAIGYLSSVAKVVNLNKFRKEKARKERRKRAQANRATHGRTRSERAKEVAQRKATDRVVAGAKLDRPTDLASSLRLAHRVFMACDGVIFDANPFKRAALERAMEPFPQESREPMRRYWQESGGVSRYVKFDHYVRTIVGLEGEAAVRATSRAIQTFATHSRAGYAQQGPVPQALEFARSVGPERIVVVSGTDQTELRHVFREAPLRSLFPTVLGSPTTKEEHLEQVLAQVPALPQNCLFIGDGGGDFAAAEHCGVPFVFLAELSDWERGTQVVGARPGNYCCEGFSDLLEAASRQGPAPGG